MELRDFLSIATILISTLLIALVLLRVRGTGVDLGVDDREHLADATGDGRRLDCRVGRDGRLRPVSGIAKEMMRLR
mgnify:CR=1 FL=1